MSDTQNLNGSEDFNHRNRAALANSDFENMDLLPFLGRHIRASMVSGVGFLTDAYDLFTINIVAYMLQLTAEQDLLLKISATIGRLQQRTYIRYSYSFQQSKNVYALINQGRYLGNFSLAGNVNFKILNYWHPPT